MALPKLTDEQKTEALEGPGGQEQEGTGES